MVRRNDVALFASTPLTSVSLPMPTCTITDQLLPSDGKYLHYYNVHFRAGLKSRQLMYVSAAISRGEKVSPLLRFLPISQLEQVISHLHISTKDSLHTNKKKIWLKFRLL